MSHRFLNAIIISIKSVHAGKIYSGDKKYELRKVAPKSFPQIVFIYETEDKKAITGAFYVKEIISLPVDDLWRRVGTRATPKRNFFSYFNGREKGIAYEIGRVFKFQTPLSLTQIVDIQSGFTIPQSFAYLSKYPILETELYSRLGVFDSKHKNDLSFSMPTSDELTLFKELALKEISKNYDEIDVSFAEAIVKSAKLGYDPHGYFTSGKQVISVHYKNEIIGFTVLSYKITGAIKTGPTLLLESYRGKGIGSKIRTRVEEFAINKGYRKLYCTCNADDELVVKYLLKSGMRVEAHLLNQYKKGSSELVLGKLLVREQHKKYPLFFRTDLEQSSLVIYDESDYNVIRSLLLSGFKKSYLPVDDVFAQKLDKSTRHFKIDKYSSKGKIIFLGKDSDNKVLSIIICSPKRGGAVKLSYISNTSNEKAFINSLSNILLFFKKHKRTKLYITIPCSDYQTLRYFEDFGFVKEGILSEPYQPGLDMFQLGYYL